jgi:hypothetical protein
MATPRHAATAAPTGLGDAVMALAASLDRLAAAIGGSSSGLGGSRPALPVDAAHWQELPVHRLRALLRSYPLDRRTLPTPIECLRRAELLEALRQVQRLG